MEKEVSANQSALELSKRKLAEVSFVVNDLRGKLDQGLRKTSDLAALLKSKSDALEAETQLRHKAQEETMALKKKMEFYQRYEVQGDKELRDELQTYKELMKCTCCRQRQKSVVLTRCFHVFCRQCIDTRIETRLRKCPNCGESFGATDVRTIYL